ncbi:MAG: acyl-ACP--UDP-N-acetylglucosamine O-acyltransferase, partial [Verrucomicrobiota bacterium]|nr:acyl-ACP--UDP-N-acetylglucosamine O-acyltransferase [Verrucomicrobiota bacterium]
MTRIHATAIIDTTAQLGAGTEIGPYCVVGPGVILGDDCWLQHHVSMSGPTRTGAGNRFYAFCSIGERSQDLKYAGEPTHLEIGEGNVFREFVTVNRATAVGAATTIGSRGNFLAYSHIAHDCRVGDAVIFSNNGTLAGHVDVGDHVIIGGLTAIHQFCRIGRHAITGGCSKIVQDVPPFMMADGNPAAVRGVNNEGLKRHGFSDETMRQLKEAFRILYRSKLNVKQAIERMRESLSASSEIDELL